MLTSGENIVFVTCDFVQEVLYQSKERLSHKYTFFDQSEAGLHFLFSFFVTKNKYIYLKHDESFL